MKSVISLSKALVFTMLLMFSGATYAEYYMVYPVEVPPPSSGCCCQSRHTHHKVKKHYPRHTYHHKKSYHKKSTFSMSTYYMWQTYPGGQTWVWVPTSCGSCGYWQKAKYDNSEDSYFDLDRRTADDVDYPQW